MTDTYNIEAISALVKTITTNIYAEKPKPLTVTKELHSTLFPHHVEAKARDVNSRAEYLELAQVISRNLYAYAEQSPKLASELKSIKDLLPPSAARETQNITHIAEWLDRLRAVKGGLSDTQALRAIQASGVIADTYQSDALQAAIGNFLRSPSVLFGGKKAVNAYETAAQTLTEAVTDAYKASYAAQRDGGQFHTIGRTELKANTALNLRNERGIDTWLKAQRLFNSQLPLQDRGKSFRFASIIRNLQQDDLINSGSDLIELFSMDTAFSVKLLRNEIKTKLDENPKADIGKDLESLMREHYPDPIGKTPKDHAARPAQGGGGRSGGA